MSAGLANRESILLIGLKGKFCSFRLLSCCGLRCTAKSFND
jgi:hypothetical protein